MHVSKPDAAGFTSNAGRALQIPQNPMTFAPSSDLLAMLSRGSSLGPTEIATSVSAQGAPDTFGDPPSNPVGGIHATHVPSELGRETRRAPFDMSEFPALAGRTQLPHGTPRDTLMEVSLNLPCGDALTMIEREQASRVDMLTCTELHGLPANVHANEHLLVDHSPLIRTTAHDFGQESSSTFAMQSEDFPALPGSQSAAPLSLGRDDSLTADNATILKESALRGPIDPDTIQFETSDNNDNSPEANKSSISTISPALASPVIGESPAAVSRRALPTSSFDRATENGNDGLLNSSNVSPPRTFSNVSEHTRMKSSLDVPGRVDGAIAGTNAPHGSKLNGNADVEKQTKYGLLGLLDVICMTNADLNTLALGSDLTTLGLNLNSSECLYSTFASPWAEAPTMREPQFSLPMCYYMQPPPLKTQHTCSLSHGACPQTSTIGLTSPSSSSKPSFTYFMPCQRTHFAVFVDYENYATLQVLQAYSAQELYNRDWQYHQDLKLWFKRGSTTDGLSTTTNQYIYFDINPWECRLFSSPHVGKNIASGL